MKNIDAKNHLTGKSVYLDDIPTIQGTLFCAVYDAPIAHAKIKHLDISEAGRMPGVAKIFTASDISGENEIGSAVKDEPLLAKDIVDFCGMPIALVVAESPSMARAAAKKIKCEFEPLEVVTCERAAHEKQQYIVAPRTFSMGDIEQGFAGCTHVFEGKTYSNGQEHLYIETQGAYAVPMENNSIKIYSSTQGPTAVQRTVATVLGVGMHQVEVDVTRLGGGFGGKEDQASAWASLVALACFHLKKPVKYSLHRMDDMRMTGKRHPYSADFKIGLNNDLKIIAYEVKFYQNAGAAADLSPAVMERTLFHSTNTYFVPNVKATAFSCKTNLPPNTAFRGFGGPQGMFVMECAIACAADELGVDAAIIQKKNLIQKGQQLSYGQSIESLAPQCWQRAEHLFKMEESIQRVKAFTAENHLFKKGFSVMPICFGISFTKTFMNQARALVHIYTDGTVLITTGAVEMGQGVNTKMIQVAADVLKIDASFIKIQSTNTFRIANTSPSAASATADLNGRAVEAACIALKSRLTQVASEHFGCNLSDISFNKGAVVATQDCAMSWSELIQTAYEKRISLSEHGHYATPTVHFNAATEKGHPFAYHVFGTALTTVTIDCLRGTYEIDSVKIVHDFGSSMNKTIDLGQIEGGLVQGIGWMTLEEIVFDDQGRLRSNALSTYKVPDIYSVPKEITIDFLENKEPSLAVFNSKAVGEPPLMYGIGTYFALRNAIKASNGNTSLPFDAPMTPEKLLMNLLKPVTSAVAEPV